MDRKAKLVLEDGIFLDGLSIGVKGIAVGELIFNTAQVGYQEAITDPSYFDQLILFTSPHIGNVGCNLEDEESSHVQAAGLILREKPMSSYYWRSKYSFLDYLEKNKVVAIAEIDTRYLTHLLRTQGNKIACIAAEDCNLEDIQTRIKKFRSANKQNLLNKVTTSFPYLCRQTNIEKPHVVVYDFGAKRNILRILDKFDCKVSVIPAAMPIQQVYGLAPDGILLSNGPGDPLIFHDVIAHVKKLIATDIPILGICLGHQLLGIALGAKIEKLIFGHHGINHPIKDERTSRVYISSQNHNFVLSDNQLPPEITVTSRSLFDFSIQGIKHKQKTIFGIQGHPEACPGPTELDFLFEPFIAAVFHYAKETSIGLKKWQSVPA